MIAELAAAQLGVVTARELHELGLTSKAISVRAANGRLHRVHRGVYAVGHAALTQNGRFLAAVNACGPGAALSHLAGSALSGYWDWEDGRYPEVTVAGGSHREHPGIVVHRTNSLPARDVIRIEGIPVTTPARTLVDLAGRLEAWVLRRLVRRAQGAGCLTAGQLAEAVVRLRPRRGISKLAEILAEGPAPTRTVLEDVVLDLILAGGFEMPDVNKPLTLSGRRIVPDFRWPREQFVLEADGAAWHENKVAREDDAERQAWLEAHGERVLRVTWRQAISESSQTHERLRAAGVPIAT